MKLFVLSFILSFFIAEPKLEGKWKMHRSEAFESILTSSNFQMQDEQQQKALAETFNKVVNGFYYDFRKDTVYFTDLKNYEIVELKGIWWTDADTLIIGQVNKISVQKYLISKINEKELHLKIIDPRSGSPSDTRLMFKR
jgi:hypothetical protein